MAIEKYNSLCGTVKDAFNGEWQSLANKTAYSLGGASVGVVEGAIGKAAITKAHAKFNNVKCNATGKGCFVAGTIVATIYGGKAIEDVEVGDKVLASDPETGETAYKEVLKTYTYVKDTLVYVTVDGETIETTKEHPFWVEGQGWTKAKFLKAGDQLRDSNENTVNIENIDIVPLPENQYTLVYNFEVADFHTYYVADSYVLVHNVCSTEGSLKISEKIRKPKDFEDIPWYEQPKNIDGKGRGKNNIRPNSNATGKHAVYKPDSVTGKITNYKVYDINSQNPSGFDEILGYDGVGKPHVNKVTGEKLLPHVHDKNCIGGVRRPLPGEIP